MVETGLTVLHLLVFAYWLGGDVGAFASSFAVANAAAPGAARVSAGRLLSTIDLAPRISLLFALPTGLSLAVVKGWVDPPDAAALAAVWCAFALWAGLVVAMHFSLAGPWARIDRTLRGVLIVALAGAAAAGAAGLYRAPAFLVWKFALLGAAVALGLHVRAVLAPFGPAFAAVARGEATDGDNLIITVALRRARRSVVVIWACLFAAAALGVARPA